MVPAAIRLAALAALVVSLLALEVSSAAAAPNPAQNIPMGSLPSSCRQAPLASPCEEAVIADLNGARKDMSLSPYYLPPNFISMSPERQTFVLSNLDRLAYSLAPVTGLNDALDASSAEGVEDDSDPWPPEELTPGGPVYGFSSNWAGGFVNVLAAYYDWMYDDGYGSPNGDCTSPGAPGCWGHRQDVLASFSSESRGFTSMGAAAGSDRSGWAGYAMLVAFTLSAPAYNYTWTSALAEGADKAPSEHESKPPPSKEPETKPPPSKEPEHPAGHEPEPPASSQPGVPPVGLETGKLPACTSSCPSTGTPACTGVCLISSPAVVLSGGVSEFIDAAAAPNIASSLASQLVPQGRMARIGALVKRGAYAFAFSSPIAGTATISWYEMPNANQRAVAAHAVRVLIATGKVSLPAAGDATTTVKLSARGRRVLGHAKQLKLVAVGTFTAPAAAPVSASRAFTLKR